MVNKPGLSKSGQSGGEIKILIVDRRKRRWCFSFLNEVGYKEKMSLELTSNIPKVIQFLHVQELIWFKLQRMLSARMRDLDSNTFDRKYKVRLCRALKMIR